MPKVRQKQGWNSAVGTEIPANYDDTLAAGPALETAATNVLEDFNGLRSQVNRTIGLTNWFDAAPNTGFDGGPMSTAKFLNNFMCSAQILTDITVPPGQNFLIIDVSSSEQPTVGGNDSTAANGTEEGAAVELSTLAPGDGVGDFGVTFELTLRTNTSDGGALSPLNIASVIDSTTRQAIQSDNGNDVLALLVAESTFTPNGELFNDDPSGNRLKLCFVRINTAGLALEACPVADIAGKTINYNYGYIKILGNVDPACFTGARVFVDQTASVDVTRKNAYVNQGAAAFVTDASATLDVGVGLVWELGDSASTSLFTLTESAGASTIALSSAVATFDSEAVVNDFANSIIVETDVGTGMTFGVLSGKFGVFSELATDLAIGHAVEGANGITVSTAQSSASVNSGTITLATGGVSTVGAIVGGDVLISTGTVSGAASSGSAGDITLSAGGVSGAGATATAGNIVLTAGSDTTAGATGVNGTVDVSTGGGANVSEADAILRLFNAGDGTGTGSGEDVQFYTGTSNPNSGLGAVSADAGSLFFQDTGSGAVAWLNTSTGTGDTWTALSTGSVEDRQDVYDQQAGAVVTQGDYNATLDIGTGGRFWEIGDLNSATILRITESSVTDATQFLVNADDIILTALAPAGAGDGGSVSIASGDGSGGFAAGEIDITAGDGGIGGGGIGGAVDINGGNAGSGSAAAGGAVSMTAGTGDGAGTGGISTMTGGTGGSAGDGGAVAVTGGAAAGTSGGNGGLADLSGGAGDLAGNGGAARLFGGVPGASGDGANVILAPSASGATSSASGGDIIGTAGAGGGTAGAGGLVRWTGGAGTAAGTIGGAVETVGGAGNATGAGGAVSVTGGVGGASSATGGAVTTTGGAGGAAAGTGGLVDSIGGAGIGAGLGGAANLTGGAGGLTGAGGAVAVTGGAGGGTSGDGGTVAVAAGATTSGNGGDVTLTAAASTGANVGGVVALTAGAGGVTADGGGIGATTGAAGGGNTQGGDFTMTFGDGAGTGVPGQLTLKGPHDADQSWFQFTGDGGGGGSAVEVAFASGVDSPVGTVDLFTTSLYHQDTNTTGVLWLNVSAGGSGTDWEQVAITDDITRQAAYDAQSTAVVDLLSSATLEVGATFTWIIRDEADKALISVGTESDTVIGASDSTVGGSPGTNVLIDAGLGLTTGSGGNAALTGGGGGASGPGGAAGITGGNAGGGNTAGGAATVTAGNSSGNIAGAGVALLAGVAGATGAGGPITIDATDAGGGGAAGGTIGITAGASDGGTTGAGATITAGAGGSAGGQGGTFAGQGGDGAGGGGGGIARLLGGTGNGSGGGGAAIIQAGTAGLTAGGGAASVIASDSGTGAAPSGGGNVAITAGDSVGTGTAAGGDITLTTGTSRVGGADDGSGTVEIVGAHDRDDAWLTYSGGAGNATEVQMFSGTNAPTVATAVTAFTGSLYHQDDNSTGALWLNTSAGGSGTDWTQIATGDVVETRAEVYVNQGTAVVDLATNATLEAGTGLTWIIRDEADTSLVSVGTQSTTVIGASDGVVATDAGSDISILAGSGLTSGTGGNIGITAGSSGNVDTTVGGSVTVSGGTSTATNAPGGDVVLKAGAGPGTGVDGQVDISLGILQSPSTSVAFQILSGDQVPSVSAESTSPNILLHALDTATLQGGNILLATASGGNGSATLFGGDAISGATGGGAADVLGGDGFTSGSGGQALMRAGAGGSVANGGFGFMFGGAGGFTSGDAGGVTISGGTPTDGNGGPITITGTSGVGTDRDGGDVTVTSGDSTGTGTTGTIFLKTAAGGSSISEDDPIVSLENQGTGTGGGQDAQFFTGESDPTATADAGSLFLQDTEAGSGSPGALWINSSLSGTPGTVWEKVATSVTVAALPRQEPVTTQVITGDLPLLDILDAVPVSNASVRLFLNGVEQRQGAGADYTVSGQTITWLAGTGTAVDMDTTDVLDAIYDSAA